MDEVDALNAVAACAFRAAAEKVLPERVARPKTPWASDATLDLIELRGRARRDHRWEEEKRLVKQIQKSIKNDRTAWLDRLIETKDWAQERERGETRATT